MTNVECDYAAIFSGRAAKLLSREYRGWAVTGKSQFTGLLDRNGKEIYEGDVIEAPGWMSGRNFPQSDNGAIFEIVWSTDSWRARRVGRLTQYQFSLLDLPEIIGNIYENPELLTN